MKSVRLARTLSFNLFLLLLIVLIIVFIIYTYIIISTHTNHLMNTVVEQANSTSDVIKRSTRYSMLLNRRDDVYQIIKTVGAEPGVEGIRIYNKKGEIMFSTLSTEENTFVDTNAEACIVCHAKNKPLDIPNGGQRTRIFKSNNGHRVLGLINPIRNENDCYTADCHFHSKSQTILGVLDVRMSLATVDNQIQDSRRIMITVAAIAILFTAVFIGGFIWRMVQNPVHKLILGTRELASGNLDHIIQIESKDEIGLLASSFNTMTQELKKARDEITDWSNTLEKKVARKTEELQNAQHHLIQIEKMASLGKLSATVAHELNNPLAGILTYTKLISRRLGRENISKEDCTSMIHDLNFMAEEINRCGNIVKNLLIFSKKSVAEFHNETIETIVDKASFLIQHHLKIKNVEFVKEVSDPECTLLCDPQALQQALIALFVNAVEAMPEGGTLSVIAKSIPQTDSIELVIKDTGVGIAEKDQASIFEPFFTTKENGKGVGLGLSVVYGIIQQHNGEIKVESKTGQGTQFIISLPKHLNKSNHTQNNNHTKPTIVEEESP